MIRWDAAAGFDRRRMIGGSLLTGMLGLGGYTTVGSLAYKEKVDRDESTCAADTIADLFSGWGTLAKS